MSKILEEISGAGLPEDFKSEIEKSAYHLVYHGNNTLLNIDSIVELDNIVELPTQADKLSAAESIFSNIDTSIPTNNSVDNNNNNETVYL